MLFFSRDLADVAALPAAIAAGGVAATLALLAVTVDETDEAFANVYSAAVTVQNVVPRVPQRVLIGAVATLATLGALTIDLLAYETFLLLLGSFFVPLFASPTGSLRARAIASRTSSKAPRCAQG